VSSQLNDLSNAKSDVVWITPTWRAYLALTKPRIIELLLVTTIPTMFLAAGGFPAWALVCWTLLGGTLAAGGANVLNCYLDRDIDAMMHRTAHRPSATGQISGSRTVTFGLILSVLSVSVLALTVNLLSAALAAFAIAFYVIGYTMLLKRRTSQNIVWGGAAGCMPVLIGWSAVTGSLSWTPVVLFLIVFLLDATALLATFTSLQRRLCRSRRTYVAGDRHSACCCKTDHHLLMGYGRNHFGSDSDCRNELALFSNSLSEWFVVYL
jgi:heme O synthase-like polyprenyltransferase